MEQNEPILMIIHSKMQPLLIPHLWGIMVFYGDWYNKWSNNTVNKVLQIIRGIFVWDLKRFYTDRKKDIRGI